jgi:hypothetical protein
MSDLLSALVIGSLALGPYLGGMLMEWIHLKLNKKEGN